MISLLSRIPLGAKIIGLVIVPLLFELGLLFSIATLLRSAEQDALRENHNRNVSLSLKNLFADYSRLGFLLYAHKENNSQEMKEACVQIMKLIPKEIRSIKSLVANGEHSKESLAQLDEIDKRTVGFLNIVETSLSDSAKTKLNLGHSLELKDSLAELLSLLRGFSSVQASPDLVEPVRDFRSRSFLIALIAGGAFVNVAVAVFLTWFSSRDILSRLRVINLNTVRAGNKQELLEQVEGNDEIASLDKFFHRMVDSLDEKSRQKDEMIAVVSHDLRAPLGSIKLTLEAMELGLMGELPTEAGKYVKGAIKTSNRLVVLLNDILDLDKLEAGQMNFTLERISLSDSIQHAIDSVESLARDKGIKIEFIPNDISAIADSGRVTQIAVNLLSNAIKFSPKEGCITVRIEKYDSMARVSIVDQGVGVPPQYVDKIFERYSQVRNSDGRRGKGTGLGLPICKKLLDGQDGKIGVTSEEGKGSTFWFELRLANDE